MAERISYFKQKGDTYIISTGLGLLLSIGMVVFIIVVILVKGLGFFWPGDLLSVKLENGKAYLGERWEEKSRYQSAPDGSEIKINEIQLKIGNRDLYGLDFVWLNEGEIVKSEYPPRATTFERFEYGNFYGVIQSLQLSDNEKFAQKDLLFKKAKQAHDQALENKAKIKELEGKLLLAQDLGPNTEHLEKGKNTLQAIYFDDKKIHREKAPKPEKENVDISGNIQCII